MFGVMFATLYASGRRDSAIPIANAIAARRRNPVKRESPVPSDMTAVLRTKAVPGSSAGGSASGGCGFTTSGVG
jgi:hypothetical protein